MEDIDFTKIFSRINLLIKSDSRKQQDLFTYLGKSRQVYYQWQKGLYAPSLTDLFKIAKYFGVPLEYIIAGEENPIDDVTAAFIVQTHGLTEEQKKIFIDMEKKEVNLIEMKK